MERISGTEGAFITTSGKSVPSRLPSSQLAQKKMRKDGRVRFNNI